MNATVMIVLTVVALCVTIAVAVVLTAMLVKRSLAGRGEGMLARRFAPGSVLLHDMMANFFGVTSRGAMQLRGNGVLALTAQELYFRAAVGSTELIIPAHAIIEVSTTRSHLGKTVGRELLHVTYRTPDGGQDSAAWFVRDLGGWLRALGR